MSEFLSNFNVGIVGISLQYFLPLKRKRHSRNNKEISIIYFENHEFNRIGVEK